VTSSSERLGCAAPASVPILRSERLTDVIALEFGFPLRRADGLPVEQFGGPTPVEVGTEHRNDKEAHRYAANTMRRQ